MGKNSKKTNTFSQPAIAAQENAVSESSSNLDRLSVSENCDPELTSTCCLSRRNLLIAGTGVAAVCGAGAMMGALRFAFPETTDQAEVRFPLGTADDFKMSTVTWIREREVFVFRDEHGWSALSSRCTHLGCTVRRSTDGFTCPCHGAQYDNLGNVVSGPARRALPRFVLWKEADGQIWVDISRTVTSSTSSLSGQSENRIKADQEQERT